MIDIIEHVEQQLAVTALLSKDDIRHNASEIDTLDGTDITATKDSEAPKKATTLCHAVKNMQVCFSASSGEAEVEPPSLKKTAPEDLLGGTFSKPAPPQSTGGVNAEVDEYKIGKAISLTSCPLQWWKKNLSAVPTGLSSGKSIPLHTSHFCPWLKVFFYCWGRCECSEISASA